MEGKKIGDFFEEDPWMESLRELSNASSLNAVRVWTMNEGLLSREPRSEPWLVYLGIPASFYVPCSLKLSQLSLPRPSPVRCNAAFTSPANDDFCVRVNTTATFCEINKSILKLMPDLFQGSFIGFLLLLSVWLSVWLAVNQSLSPSAFHCLCNFCFIICPIDITLRM